MNPEFLPVPKATAGMAIASIIGVGILLVISVILAGLVETK